MSALTIAEYFRDELGRDVLLLMDNVFRFRAGGQRGLGPLAGCRASLDGAADEWAESSLYMVGSLDDARQKEAEAARAAA